MAVQQPRLALGLIVAGLAVLFAFRAPVAHLLGLIALTAIVPLDVQARFGSGGSVAAAGVLPSDVLLLAGLARALVVLPRQPLSRRASVTAGLTAAFLLVAALQLLHALTIGRPISGVGGEFRALLGFGALFVALPILADSRRRAAGCSPGSPGSASRWGCGASCSSPPICSFYDEPDAPIAAGSFLTAGRVVGLFCFPVAAIVALAVLTGAPSRRLGARVLLSAVVVTNCVAIVLTFERTFVLVLARRLRPGVPAGGGTAARPARVLGHRRGRVHDAGGRARGAGRALRLPVRLASVGCRARPTPPCCTASRRAGCSSQQIRARPVVGSALGATILIGRPGTNRRAGAASARGERLPLARVEARHPRRRVDVRAAGARARRATALRWKSARAWSCGAGARRRSRR